MSQGREWVTDPRARQTLQTSTRASDMQAHEPSVGGEGRSPGSLDLSQALTSERMTVKRDREDQASAFDVCSAETPGTLACQRGGRRHPPLTLLRKHLHFTLIIPKVLLSPQPLSSTQADTSHRPRKPETRGALGVLGSWMRESLLQGKRVI